LTKPEVILLAAIFVIYTLTMLVLRSYYFN
jgi:hypothetical protein